MKKIILLNHKEKKCGVYQYGLRTGNIITNSKNYNILYREINSKEGFDFLIKEENPDGLIYNYNPMTMLWLDNNLISSLPVIKHYGISHECLNINFNYHISQDPNTPLQENVFPMLRPLFKFEKEEYKKNEIPVIGSFGFGFENKGFDRLCEYVNSQFDEAIIRLNITFAYFGDQDGNRARNVANMCRSKITKENIKLEISHDFLDNEQILDFLSDNSINVFLYDYMGGRGNSSVLDYALSVKRPIAISNSYMFRHVPETNIQVESISVKDIMDNGCEILDKYKNAWSHENFINAYENILNKTL